MLKTLWFWITLMVMVILLGGSWIVFSKNYVGNSIADGGSLEPAPVAGHPAPNIALADIEGQVIRLSDYKGKPVIVNFWATWCAPCRAEFPEFQQAAVDNADTLTIIGINSTSVDQAHLIPGFLDEYGITFPIVLDESGETVKKYQILGLPTTVFIDSKGIVNEVFTGPLNKAYIESKISELQAGL
jgi:peroxiredoxin